MATTPKVPQDHKPKKADRPDHFSFTYKETEYHLAETEKVLAPGFMRSVRRMGDLDAMFTMLEELADKDALAAVDKMTRSEFDELVAGPFLRHIEVDMGESEAS